MSEREWSVFKGNSGYLRHAVVKGVALCGYQPQGATAMGRGRARWVYAGDACQGVDAVSCEKCKKALPASP